MLQETQGCFLFMKRRLNINLKFSFNQKKNMIALDLIHFFSAYVRSEYIMYVLRMYC